MSVMLAGAASGMCRAVALAGMLALALAPHSAGHGTVYALMAPSLARAAAARSGAARNPALGGDMRSGPQADVPALPVETANPLLNQAEQVALGVLARDTYRGKHLAAPFYDSPWIRDSYAWGMIPWSGPSSGALSAYSTSELQYWLAHQRAGGSWITNIWSGWYDETPIMIAALADSFRVGGDVRMLRAALPRAERAWQWLATTQIDPAAGSSFLIYASVGPHVAADWADQVARSGYTTGVEALWYHATVAMADMEVALGSARRASRYRAFAAGIRRDINRLLWRVSAPHARNAPATAPTGHYTGWTGVRDYFELDSNFLCILYGIASPVQTAAIERFTMDHKAYLLGLGARPGVPARTVYGDYEPADYASIHYNLQDGRYQNAYWPSLGAMIAMAAAHSGDRALAAAILHRLAVLFTGTHNISEWYTQDGTASGAVAYQWPARMYLIALYTVYLGLDESWQAAAGNGRAPARVHCLGSGSAWITVHGHNILATVTGGNTGACAATVQPLD